MLDEKIENVSKFYIFYKPQKGKKILPRNCFEYLLLLWSFKPFDYAQNQV